MRPASPWPAKAGAWLLATGVAGAALAVGTVHAATLCVVTGVLAVSAALSWWNAEPSNMRAAATVLLVTGGVLTTYTAMQCIPMPIEWLAKIAPHNADVWSRSLAPLHARGPRWAPISIDPTSTRVEALKGTAYLLAFLSALRTSRSRRGVAFLSYAIVVTGVMLAIAALLHPAFGAHKLYGVWQPQSNYERHLAPFLNPNNLAAYLNVALCLALSAALAPEPRVPRPVWAAGLVLLAATQIWVASRAGVAAMVLGAALVVGISHASRMKQRQTLVTVSLVAAAVIAASIFMIVLGASEEASSELLVADLSKLAMFGEAMRMLPSSPFFGVGRGAFETAFPAFRQSVGYVTFVYPENVIAQWLIEWGAPLGLAGLVGIVFGLRPNAVLARSHSAAGAWAAIVAVAVQNLLDLGSEIPGLMLAPVICGALVTGGSAGRRPRRSLEKWGRAPRGVALACLAIAACALMAVVPELDKSVDDDRKGLEDAVSHGVSKDQMHALAWSAMLRHPGEPYLPFVTAVRAYQAKDDDPMPWLEATLERGHVYGPAHLFLARFIAPRSPAQARFEYRLAMEQAPGLVGSVMQEAPRWVRGYDDAMDLVPAGKVGIDVLESLSTQLRLRLPATCVRLDVEQASRDPIASGPALRAAGAAIEDVEATTAPSWCLPPIADQCARRALDLADRAEQLAPGTSGPRALHARAQLAAGNAAGALRELTEACDIVSDRVACLQALVGLAQSAHDERRVAETTSRIASAGCADEAECARNLAWVANIEEQRGNRQRALAFYKRAYERAPEDDTLLEQIARLGAASGMHAEAARNYEKLANRHPADARWKSAANSERAAVINEAISL